MTTEVKNPVLARASKSGRAIAKATEERDSTLEKMLRTTRKHIPRFPKIRQDDPDFWYTGEIDERFAGQTATYVASFANRLWRGESTAEFSLTGETGDPRTEFYTLGLQDIFNRYLENQTPSDDMLALFFLMHGGMLRSALVKKTAEDGGGIKGIFTPQHKTNFKIYQAAKELQAQHNKFFRDELSEINNLDPSLIKRGFGENGIADFDDTIGAVIYGRMNARNGKNGVQGNPWALFDFDPADFRPEEFEVVLAERYGTMDVGGKRISLLTPSRMAEIQRVLVNQAKREESSLGNGKGNEAIKYVLNESNFRRLLTRPWPVKALLDQAAERSGVFSDLSEKKDSEDKRLYSFEKVMEAYRAFVHDMHLYAHIRELEAKINVVPTDFSEVGTDGPKDPNAFAFAPDRSPIRHDLDELVVYVDTRGYSKIASKQSSKETYDRQSKTIHGEIKKAAKEFGLEFINEEGDAIILSGRNVDDTLYFARVLKSVIKPQLARQLEKQHAANIKRLERKVQALLKRQSSSSLYGEVKGGSTVERDLNATRGKIEYERDRLAVLGQHPPDFRIGIAKGPLYRTVDEYNRPEVSGPAIGNANRLMAHDKTVQNAPYDVRVVNGTFDNQSGIALESEIVEGLERHVKEQAGTIVVHKGVRLPGNETPYDFTIHKELDGSELVYQTLSPDAVQIYSDFKGKVSKMVIDPNELKIIKEALGKVKTPGFYIPRPPV